MPSPSPTAEARYPANARRARPLLGTLVEIDAAANRPAAALHCAIDAGFAAIERIHALMSGHDPGSELSRINRNACHQVQRVDAHTYRVLEAALEIAGLSNGAFDPCVARHLEASGYLPRNERPVEDSAGWRDIELLDGNGVRFLRPLRLDLGGIAKGYAVDLAVRTLQELEIDQIAVNAGGDLRIAGPQPRSVQLRHPQNPSRLAQTVTLRNAAFATSAAYYSRRLMRGREVSALIASHSGDPYVGNQSISVRANSCMAADALTKVVLFADAGIAERCLSACHAEAFVLNPVHVLADSNRSISARSRFNCVAASHFIQHG
jgi:FAD:protein FMN transferase